MKKLFIAFFVFLFLYASSYADTNATKAKEWFFKSKILPITLGGHEKLFAGKENVIKCTRNDRTLKFYINHFNAKEVADFFPSSEKLPNGADVYNASLTSNGIDLISKATYFVFYDETKKVSSWVEGHISSKKKYYYIINEIDENRTKLDRVFIIFDNIFLNKHKDIKKSINKLSKIYKDSINFTENQPGKNLYEETDKYMKKIIDTSVEAQNIIDKYISSFETQKISFQEYSC